MNHTQSLSEEQFTRNSSVTTLLALQQGLREAKEHGTFGEVVSFEQCIRDTAETCANRIIYHAQFALDHLIRTPGSQWDGTFAVWK